MSVVKKHIEVVPYDPQWPQVFEKEKLALENALQKNSIAIHHVGSTSIPGLSAKPKIDIIAVVHDPKKAAPALETIGYTYKGAWNIPFKFGFSKREPISVNLHVFEENHPEIALNLLFRDYLREHADAKATYATLKETLLEDPDSFIKHDAHFTGYNLGKAHFIMDILEKAGFTGHRFVHCIHHAEREAAQKLKSAYLEETGIELPDFSQTQDLTQNAFVFYQGMKIIGVVETVLFPAHHATISLLTIDKAFRNQGCGGQFLSFVERWLHEQNAQWIDLIVSVDALPFYTKRGFEPIEGQEQHKWHIVRKHLN